MSFLRLASGKGVCLSTRRVTARRFLRLHCSNNNVCLYFRVYYLLFEPQLRPARRGDSNLNTAATVSCHCSELQSARAAERSAGGAAVCGAASGAGTEAAARVPGRGSPAAAPHPQTGEEETQTSQKKPLPSLPSPFTQDAVGC